MNKNMHIFDVAFKNPFGSDLNPFAIDKKMSYNFKGIINQ